MIRLEQTDDDAIAGMNIAAADLVETAVVDAERHSDAHRLAAAKDEDRRVRSWRTRDRAACATATLPLTLRARARTGTAARLALTALPALALTAGAGPAMPALTRRPEQERGRGYPEHVVPRLHGDDPRLPSR